MDGHKYRVDGRRSICSRCRQRFSATDATEIYCPTCRKTGPVRTPYEMRLIRCPPQPHCYMVEKIATKFRPRTKSESLNCNPSPMSASRESALEVRKSPRKRALLIGVTYRGAWKYRLKGPVNDVKNMKNLLVQDFGFDPHNILILTEEEPDDELIPTKKNIHSCLEWLVEGCQSGDSLVFYFSGHGLRQPDFNGDELDGFDETICPVDFIQEGMILDNDINSTLVWPLKKGVTLHAIVDACHSGTILDLLYVYDRENKKWKDNRPPSGAKKSTNGGLAISICACEDNQMAADTSAFRTETGRGMTGAMTSILIEILKNNRGVTYGDLLDIMHETLDDVKKNRCLPTRILKLVSLAPILQRPQLSASEPFDVQKPFKL